MMSDDRRLHGQTFALGERASTRGGEKHFGPSNGLRQVAR